MATIELVEKIIDEAISEATRAECAYYHGRLLEKSRDESLPEEVRTYLSVAGQVASYHFKHENTKEPFGPVFQSSEGRSAIPADLTDDGLNTVEELCVVVSAPELLARLFDVLWLRRRKPAFAENAIATYLDGAQKGFDLEHWTFCAELAERALRLASIFRRGRPELFDSAADLLLSWINDHFEDDEKFLTARSIRLLLQYGHGDPAQLLERARKVGERASKREDFHCAEEYWRLAVKCARAAEDEDSANAAQTQLAECYVENARRHSKSGMNAAHWMQQAIEAYKAVPGTKELREELYAELLQYQRDSRNEMGKFETSFDISDLLKWTTSCMAGRSTVREAIFAFAFELAQPLDYVRLRDQAKKLAEKFPLSSIFPAVHLDEEGRVVARSSGSSSDGVAPHELYRLAGMEHQLTVAGNVLPAIEIVTSEHDLSGNVLLKTLENNPFVAQGQETLYAKGLHAGFDGDFVTALSILIPLLENSIRTVLAQAGVRTSTLNSHGVQEVIRMGTILDHEKTLELFGESIVLDLKGLLVERTYGNLRNNFSHGMLTECAFYHHSAIYLWWLILRLCLTPTFVAERKANAERGQQDTQSEEDQSSADSE